MLTIYKDDIKRRPGSSSHYTALLLMIGNKYQLSNFFFCAYREGSEVQRIVDAYQNARESLIIIGVDGGIREVSLLVYYVIY